MSATVKPFSCLRCGHRYQAEHAKGVVVERSCRKCGSNSVRLVPEKRAAARSQDSDDH